MELTLLEASCKPQLLLLLASAMVWWSGLWLL
jgi:hypothetical protein